MTDAKPQQPVKSYTKSLPHLSIVIPIHDEAQSINHLVQEIENALKPKYIYEIIFVDDCSTDQTPIILKAIKAENSHIRILRHKKKYGQSTAIITGVRAASNSLIVTLDGDGQNDPADIDHFISVFNNQNEDISKLLIVGNRLQRKDPFWKRFSSKITNNIRRFFLQDETPDTGCGLKIFSKKLFLSLPAFNHMHRFLPALVKREGGQVISMNVNHRPRSHGHSHYGTASRLFAGIIDLFGVLWLKSRDIRPEIEDEDDHF